MAQEPNTWTLVPKPPISAVTAQILPSDKTAPCFAFRGVEIPSEESNNFSGAWVLGLQKGKVRPWPKL